MKKLVTYIGFFLLFGFLLPLESQFRLEQRVSFDREAFQLFDSGEGLYGIEAAEGNFFFKAG